MSPAEKARLRKATLAFIERMHAIHKAASGALALSEIVALFGVNPPPKELSKRDEVHCKRINETTGSFVNEGSPMNVNAGGLAIEIPAALRGEYEVAENRVALRFDEDASISGKKFFVRATLLGLSADDTGINFDIRGPIPLPNRIDFE